VSVTLAATAAVLFSVGTYLVLQRALTRVILGLAILSHGANALLMASGRRGVAPIVGAAAAGRPSDPLPQALALTAIVISFGVTMFLLALVFRSWVLTRDDEVQDDVEDRLIARAGWRDLEVADEEAVREEIERDEPMREPV
jgi:multicomponent Na+:H+ antiporter subunit C